MNSEIVDTRIWRVDGLDGAMLFRGRFSGFSYDVHIHETACFALLTHGAIHIKMPTGEYIARAGDLYAIDAGEPHAGWPVDGGGWTQRTLYIGLDRLASLTGEDVPLDHAALNGPIIQDGVLTDVFKALHHCSETSSSALLRDECMQMFIARLLQRHMREGPRIHPPGQENKAVLRAREYLDEHLEDNVALARIACEAGLSSFRLYRAFIRAYGMTPHTYQRQSRIHRATGLIRAGWPLCEVSPASGFSDQAHMTRSFRRSLGVTPGMYQRAMAGRAPCRGMNSVLNLDSTKP